MWLDIRSHLVLSLTGGFYIGLHDLWPNLIKSIILALLSIPFFIVLYLDFSQSLSIVMASIVSLIVLIVKLIAVSINRRFDDAITLPDSPVDRTDESGFELPSGVSMQLWNRRRILFRRDVTTDDAAMDMIGEGFDPDSVFTLVQLVQSGTITHDTVLADPSQRVHSNVITLGGRTFTFPVDRTFLSRICARPSGPWEAVRSAVMAFVMAYLVSYNRYLERGVMYVYFTILCALSVFSMILPPPCDPYSTTSSKPGS